MQLWGGYISRLFILPSNETDRSTYPFRHCHMWQELVNVMREFDLLALVTQGVDRALCVFP